jgi:hypothetical protein
MQQASRECFADLLNSSAYNLQSAFIFMILFEGARCKKDGMRMQRIDRKIGEIVQPSGMMKSVGKNPFEDLFFVW